MTYGIAYSLVTDIHFVAGQIVTIKPQGSVWNDPELTGMGFFTLVISDDEYQTISNDLANRKVDSVSAPTTVVSIA